MVACQHTDAKTPMCVAVATHPAHEPKFCAVHKQCRICGTHHPDKDEYRCAKCGVTMCVARTTLSTRPDDRKKFVRFHEPRPFDKCGPVEPTGTRL